MSADFESDLAILYGRQPDMPDAGAFAVQITERVVREERRKLVIGAVAVVGVAAIAAPVAVRIAGDVISLTGEVTRSTQSFPMTSSPLLLSLGVVVAMGAVLFGRMQARRL